MMKRMGMLSLLCLVAMATASERREIKAFDQTALNAFLVPFRERVLHTVAVTWNHTIAASAALKVQLVQCSNTIKASVQQCGVCTKAVCNSPSPVPQVPGGSAGLVDYLNLLNPYSYLKEPLDEIGSRLGDVVDLLGSGSSAFIDSMKSLGSSVGGKFTDVFGGLESGLATVGNTFSSVGGGIVGVGNTIGHGLTDTANTVGHGLTDAANTVGHGLTDVGNSVQHIATDFGNTISHLFGKRDIDPTTRHCMEQCATCRTLLITNQREMIKAVCGADVVNFNDTVRQTVSQVKSIFVAVSDKIHPIVTKLEYDTASVNGTEITGVFVTANVRGRYVRYQSHVTYHMVNQATAARAMADEYWRLWS